MRLSLQISSVKFFIERFYCEENLIYDGKSLTAPLCFDTHDTDTAILGNGGPQIYFFLEMIPPHM